MMPQEVLILDFELSRYCLVRIKSIKCFVIISKLSLGHVFNYHQSIKDSQKSVEDKNYV